MTTIIDSLAPGHDVNVVRLKIGLKGIRKHGKAVAFVFGALTLPV